MTANAGSGDAWRVAGEDRAKHDAQFFSLKPVNGFITGEQARGFFMQSGLPTPVLGQIWGLADMNNDGKMDKKEFSIAMHLIKKKLQGYELPKALPQALKADPSPVIGSFGTMPAQPSMMGMGPGMVGMAPPVAMAMGSRMPMMTNGMQQMVVPPGYMGAPPSVPVSAGFSGAMPVRPAGAPGPSGGNMAMPHQSKLKYTQIFNSNDRNKKGSLTGVEARSILMNTGVPQQMLAQIWNLSDVDKDGRLDCEEFCIAMHLIDMLKMGQALPVKLPPELFPGKVRSGSFGSPPATAPQPVVGQKDNFGDLLGGMGMPAPVQPVAVANGETKAEERDISPVTFEDKRKLNFDKGQAELERRRQMLQDQMKKENDARLEKERKEHEKREKHRQEQEMKRHQEMEKQLEKQRQIERQKEEQRQKMMEQREAARRELERQRQMEWERQRKEQLMAEKAREYEQLTSIKSQSSNLKCELESLQGKKTEMSTKISQVKNAVTDFTAHIEAMRSTRDLKNQDIDRFQRELQELNQKLLAVQSEKQNLDLRVQTSIQSNPMSETHRTMMHSVELKKTSVQRLKKDLEQIEKETETKLTEIDIHNTQVKEMSDTLSKTQNEISRAEKNKQDGARKQKDEDERVKKEKEKHEKLRKELEAQRLKEETERKQKAEVQNKPETSSGGNWFDFGGDTKASTTTNDNWASVFDSQPSTQASTEAWGASFSSQNTTAVNDSDQKSFKLSGAKQKFKAMYQFDARNEDELSLNPGDTVMVFNDQTGAEPGWKGGEMNGKCGWFPEAYVEKIVAEQSSQSLFGSTDLSAGITSSEDSSFMAVPGKMPAVSPTPGQGQTAPEGLQAQALYPWKAKKDNHLTFNKGDVIQVREQQDMWWSGELYGKVGWFPKSYVKLISGPSNTPVPVVIAQESASNSPSLTPTSTLEKSNGSARQSPALDRTAGDTNTYIALYPYQSTEPGDLNFNQGDVMIITKMDGDWWTGTLGDKTGVFPANYVKKHEVQPAEFPGLTANTSNSDFAGFDMSSPPGDTASPFTDDPFSGSNVISDNNGSPFGELNTVLSDGVNPPFMEDPFSNADAPSDLGQGLMGDPFAGTDDPFKEANTSTFHSDFGSDSQPSPFPDSSFQISPFPEDPFTSAKQESAFPASQNTNQQSDPFTAFSDQSSNNNAVATDQLSNTDVRPAVDTSTDPYSAFAGLNDGNVNQTDTNLIPDSPSDWLKSVEKDANTSISSDLGSLTGPEVLSANCDSSIQTSGSFSNLEMFGNAYSDSVNSTMDAQTKDIQSNASPFDSLMGSVNQNAKPSGSPLNDLMGLQAQSPISSKSPFENLTSPHTEISSASPFDNLMGLQTQSPVSNASPFDDLMGLQTQNPASDTSLINDASGLKAKPDRPPLPKKITRVRGGSLNKPGLDPNSGLLEFSDVTEVGLDTDQVDGVKQSSTGTLKKPEIATVIAAYSATGEEQLSLNPGQLIQVRKKSPSGWWEGELQARGQKRKIGWFPANYVKLLGASARSTPDNTLTAGDTISPPATAFIGNTSATPSPAPQSTTPQPTSQTFVDHVIALYPYTAQNLDELTFQKDAVINVIKKDDPDWWQGEFNGQTGMFPSNYVQNTTPEANSWSNDPQVLAITSPEEGKRQSYIHELINTEESYMQDMSIVLEAFYQPLAETEAITQEELLAIFVNWKDLIVCNTKLQKALRVRKKMCGVGQVIISIGDILCENIPHLTPYIRFCSCQLNAAALLQRLTENNSRFTEIHKKCVQNPKTKGMPLSSFLLKPMQRITKYPLIVEKILKYTPEGHPDHNHLKDALEQCQEMCSQVNEGVREKENSDRLEWIQQHVHCDGLPEKITFNSGTNCLGPRKLLHTGVLYKTKSNKELAAFLFNDFLLLTTSNRPLSSATHSVFDVTGQVQYKMYKTPIFLNEVMVKKPSGEDTESFQVSHIDRVYNLKCHHTTDRDTWVRHLDTASRCYLDTESKKREKAISSPKSSRGVGRLLVIILEGSNLVCSKDVRRSPGVGRLLVVIIEGIDLQACDANGKSDPYCEVSMGAQEHKTKVINNTLNPKWNASMQFSIRDVEMDTLCITVFDRDLFSPNDFLGRTEIRVSDIIKETTVGEHGRRPITKHLVLHEVPTGEVVVKLDLHYYDQT